MKRDPQLRALVKALREGSVEALRLRKGYRSPCTVLDVEAAIDELQTWGTTEHPRNISPELRQALTLFLQGKIRMKRGRKTSSITRTQLAVFDVADRHIRHNVPIGRAIKEAAATFKVTPPALDAMIYPRKRRKST